MDVVDSIKKLLQSSTLKNRKEGVKQLDAQLDSPLFLHQLDANTAKLWPQDRLTFATWPGLLDLYLGYVSKEVIEHNKQPDAAACKVLRRIFTEADNHDRCGPGRNNLLRRAGVAFDKIQKVLEKSDTPGAGLATPLGKEFVTVLLKVLLLNADYCQRSSVATFQGLLEEAMCRFESLQKIITDSDAAAAQRSAAAAAVGRLASGQAAAGGAFGRASKEALAAENELHSMSALIAGLLGGMPGQLATAFAVDMGVFLVTSLQWLGEQRRFGRLDVQLLSSLNGLLLLYGHELATKVGKLHEMMAEYIKHAWGERNTRLKECLLCFCRVSLALGGPQGCSSGTALSELLQLATRDINSDNFAWDLAGIKQHQQLAALAASLYYHTTFAPAGSSSSAPRPTATANTAPVAGSEGSSGSAAAAAAGGAAAAMPADGGAAADMQVDRQPGTAAAAAAAGDVDDDLAFLPRKRSKLMQPGEQLRELLQLQPERWGPVVALLLHLHGPLLPADFQALLLQQLANSIGRIVNSATSGSSRSGGSGSSNVAAATAAGLRVYRRSVSPAADGHGRSAAAAAAVPPGEGAGLGSVAAAAVKVVLQQQQQLQWLLRCCCELALSWPANLHPLSAAAAAAASTGRSGSSAGVTGAAGLGCSQPGRSHESRLQTAGQTTAAAAAAVAAWQQLWDSLLELVAAADQQLLCNFPVLVVDAIAWQLHMLLARRLVLVPSKSAALLHLLPLLLPQQQQQQQQRQQYGDVHTQQQQQQQPQQHFLLSDAQLALIASLCFGENLSSHSEVTMRQQLLQACLHTAELHCSNSRFGSSGAHRISNAGAGSSLSAAAAAGAAGASAAAAAVAAAAGGGAAAAAAASCLPDVLLPAILALLEAPGLPTLGLNGCGPAAAGGGGGGAAVSAGFSNGTISPGPGGVLGFSELASGGCDVVWYHVSSWWLSDQRVEGLMEGLESGLEQLQRRMAAVQLQQVLSAAAKDAALANGAATANAAAAAAAGGAGAVVDSAAGQGIGFSSPGFEDSGVLSVWWRCWCQLADGTAEALTQALGTLLPEDDQTDDQQQPPWPQQDNPAAAAVSQPAVDPVRKLCHLLLLANVAANLPCIAAMKCVQLQLMQQQQQHQGLWCGVSFSGLPGLHVQLQQLVLQAVEHGGQLLREHLSELPCIAGSTWLQQLQHLGASLARLQRLTDLLAPKTPPAAAAAAPAAAGQANAANGNNPAAAAAAAAAAADGNGGQPAVVSSKDVALAVAAGMLQPVVLQLQQVVTAAAAAAVAAPDDPRFKKCRSFAAGDVDLDDDFPTAAPSFSRPFSSPTTSTFSGMPGAAASQGLGFGPSQQGLGAGMGPPSVRPAAAAAAATAGAAAGPGYALLMSGGLAGFAGRENGGLGSWVLAPALAGFDPAASGAAAAGGVSLGFRHGFALGGLNEGLAGVSGALGVGLRVLASLSHACGPDAAQGLLQLWRHVSGVGGGAPSETILEALVETMCVAVCAGGWVQLGQLMGLIRGSHTLLAAQKVPLSTLHLVLRLLQAVAVSAAAAGMRLSCVRDAFLAAVSQGSSQEDLEEGDGSLLDDMMQTFKDVHTRLTRLRSAGSQEQVHNPLPLATQLQLGLTILALLQLQPQFAYGSSSDAVTGAAAAAAADMEGFRAELLELLDCSSTVLRVRSGPLAAQLISDAAAAASAVVNMPGSNGSSNSSVAAAVAAAMADIQPHLVLQLTNKLSQQQQEHLRLLQIPAYQQTDDDRAGIIEATRCAKQDLLYHEVTLVQLTDLAVATAAGSAAAIEQQEAPNTLDVLLLQLLCSHAACTQQLPAALLPGLRPYQPDSKALSMQLAAAALDVLAVQQQYHIRAGYLAYQAPAWIWQWFASGRDFEQLLLLQPLLCPAKPSSSGSSGGNEAEHISNASQQAGAAAAAAGTLQQAAEQLLSCYGREIMISLLYLGADQQLQAVADAAGMQLPALLQQYRWDVFGALYPRYSMSRRQVQDRAVAVAEKVGYRTVPHLAERLTCTSHMAVMSLPSLGSCQQEPAGSNPRQWEQQQQDKWCNLAEQQSASCLYYPMTLAKQALLAFCKNINTKDAELSPLTRGRIVGEGLQQLLLHMHRNITAACNTMHKLQRLGQLEALMHVMTPQEMAAPATTRYLISILLQQLHSPALQPECCDLLQVLYQQLYQLVAAADQPAAPVAAGQAGGKAAAKAAQEQRQQQLQQQQLAVALLAELLPPTVAALVQCVEAAAAAQQLQQQQLMWNSPGKTAPLMPIASGTANGGTTAAAAADLSAEFGPVRLLLVLLRKPPQPLMPVVQTLDLLPPLPVLAAPAALQLQLQQGLRLPQRVVMLADRAAGMAASSRQRVIQAITLQLQHSTAELYELPAVEQEQRVSADGSNGRRGSSHHTLQAKGGQSSTAVQQQQASSSSSSSSLRRKVEPAVVSAAFKLAKLGAQLADRSVTELSGHLLAIAGPLDANIITFDTAAWDDAAATGSSSSSSAAADDAGLTAFPMRAVLQHLVDCLFSCEAHVVAVAQATLPKLLAIPAAAEVVHSLRSTATGSSKGAVRAPAAEGSSTSSSSGSSALLESYLSIYESSQQASQLEVDNEAAAEALEAATTAALWSPLGLGFNTWLCRLCSTLLVACGATPGEGGALMQLLAGAAALKPGLAELLLPHALLQLCASDGSGAQLPGVGSVGLAPQLGACITKGLQLASKPGSSSSSSSSNAMQGAGSSSSSSVDIRCLGVLLACLEHNRIVHRRAFMALQPPQCANPSPVCDWQRCYCLHIDYLAVAAAAMACRAYFTALIYIEHWCEEQYGKLTLNPATDADAAAGSSGSFQLLQLQQLAGLGSNSGVMQVAQQQQNMLEQLLLELYSNVNEPDGIYAVAAAFSSTASQLHLLRHEQQWAMVLGVEDALLQTTAVQQRQRQQVAVSSTGVLTALQQLGCHSTAEQCLPAAAAAASHSSTWHNAGQSSSSGLHRQQQQQQMLLETQCELAWRLSDWGIADSIMQQQSGSSPGTAGFRGSSSSSSSSSLAAAAVKAEGSGQRGFHASVLTALQALQAKDLEGFTSSVSGARHNCVLHLANSSTQSAAAVNPILVQLRMLHMLQQGLEWARGAAAAAAVADRGHLAASRPGSRSGSNEPTAAAEGDAEQLLQHLLGADYLPGGRSAAAEQLQRSKFHLSDQLLAVQAALTKVLRRPDGLALTLQAHARTARKAGQVNFASAALNQLQLLLQQSCEAAAAAAEPAGSGGRGAAWQQHQAAGDMPGQQKLPAWLSGLVAHDAAWLLESVKLKWLQGQQLPAYRELKVLVAALQAQQQQQAATAGSSSSSMLAALMRAQALAGEWMAAGQFSSSGEDALGLFKSAAAVAQQQQQQQQQRDGSAAAAAADMSRLHCRVYFLLALYADQRFRELETQMASPEWQKQLGVLQRKQKEIQDFEDLKKDIVSRAMPKQQMIQQVNHVVTRQATVQKYVDNDIKIVQQIRVQRDTCLRIALNNYRNCIAAGSRHDLQVVYRLCRIWFKYCADDAVNGALGDVFATVPSAKFVPLVYQIASRLDSSKSNFQAILKTALSRLAQDHPYHTLYSLIALSNGSNSKEVALMKMETDMGKVDAAADLLRGLKKGGSERLNMVIEGMVEQVQVYIDIGTMKVPRDTQGRLTVKQVPMPGGHRRRLLGATAAPPICLSLDLDPTCQYEHVPHVVDVDSTIHFVGGVNAPMVFTTTDSTGHRQKQLVKSGSDDMRQDAVMQQFFGLVNALLASSSESSQRQLSLRTYRVVPCSPIVGLVEWVEGTQPLGDWLADGDRREGGACARYRKPGQLSWFDCYSKLLPAPQEQRKDIFLYLTSHFPPVFHNFFLERFPHPARWFEARTRYTRSTAVSSMAGAIIGLGDRHMNNILLDLATAEVLHIDLGIAFEQGLFLRTPERVPFRLTSNVVDGMGAAGVEGTFRRCCEKTLETLRNHKEALLTVMEVVLHDPLYKWQMTPLKANRKQQDPLAAAAGTAAQDGGSGGSGSGVDGSGYDQQAPDGATGAAGVSGVIGNADAERAVLRVKQKLEGQDVEGGVALSVAAQVGKWLQDAQDPDKLCYMFVGWAAWL